MPRCTDAALACRIGRIRGRSHGHTVLTPLSIHTSQVARVTQFTQFTQFTQIAIHLHRTHRARRTRRLNWPRGSPRIRSGSRLEFLESLQSKGGAEELRLQDHKTRKELIYEAQGVNKFYATLGDMSRIRKTAERGKKSRTQKCVCQIYCSPAIRNVFDSSSRKDPARKKSEPLDVRATECETALTFFRSCANSGPEFGPTLRATPFCAICAICAVCAECTTNAESPLGSTSAAFPGRASPSRSPTARR